MPSSKEYKKALKLLKLEMDKQMKGLEAKIERRVLRRIKSGRSCWKPARSRRIVIDS